MNLYPMVNELLESESQRLAAMGVFALVRGLKRVSTANGKGMEVEDCKAIKLPLLEESYINPAVEERISPTAENQPMPSEDYDSLAIDGFPGSSERIEQLAAFYDANGSKEDRRGNEVSPAKASPCVLTESEESERLIEQSKQWADIPANKRTPFQQAIMAIVASELGS
jgi:hypothetical protein